MLDGLLLVTASARAMPRQMWCTSLKQQGLLCEWCLGRLSDSRLCSAEHLWRGTGLLFAHEVVCRMWRRWAWSLPHDKYSVDHDWDGAWPKPGASHAWKTRAHLASSMWNPGRTIISASTSGHRSLRMALDSFSVALTLPQCIVNLLKFAFVSPALAVPPASVQIPRPLLHTVAGTSTMVSA